MSITFGMMHPVAWGIDTVYLQGINEFSAVVDGIPVGAWESPTPCAGWRALDVLGHVGTATDFGNRLLNGETPAWSPVEPPGAAVVGDPSEWWRTMAEEARRLVPDADLSQEIDSPSGRRSIADGLRFPAIDLFIHAWDLGRISASDVEIPSEVIEFAHEALDPIPTGQLRSPRVFAEPVSAPVGASATERFLAWTGRDPRWRTR